MLLKTPSGAMFAAPRSDQPSPEPLSVFARRMLPRWAATTFQRPIMFSVSCVNGSSATASVATLLSCSSKRGFVAPRHSIPSLRLFSLLLLLLLVAWILGPRSWPLGAWKSARWTLPRSPSAWNLNCSGSSRAPRTILRARCQVYETWTVRLRRLPACSLSIRCGHPHPFRPPCFCSVGPHPVPPLVPGPCCLAHFH